MPTLPRPLPGEGSAVLRDPDHESDQGLLFYTGQVQKYVFRYRSSEEEVLFSIIKDICNDYQRGGL